ncbi:MAG: DUF1624 domain-containing protein [Oscillospiraceae bacterium]|nr:DUF1624 domain-containing protein [Oscillospiraceae bacterium]
MEGSVYSPVRAHFLDELRGTAIILMVLHHAAWDLNWLFGASVPWLDHPVVEFWRTVFSGCFVFISGMVCNTSRSNRKRGLVTLGCAVAITLVTRMVTPQMPVRFGILHLLGICMLLYSWWQRPLRRLPAEWGMAAAFALCAFVWHLPNGYVGWGSWSVALPQTWYTFDLGYVLGLPKPQFSSSDYFPLVPWGFLFFGGSFAGRWVFAQRSPGWLFQSRVPLLGQVGRHTLWVYLLHQPLIFGLLKLTLG